MSNFLLLGLVQSFVFGFAHILNDSGADGHVLPSAQHWEPAHICTLPGHRTSSPTLQLAPAGCGGAGVGGVGVGGVGLGGGLGRGLMQSLVFGFAQPLNDSGADGHVLPSMQHCAPSHFEFVPGHSTGSPILQLPPGLGGVGGLGCGGGVGGVGLGGGVGGVGCGGGVGGVG